jgi:hypothetical protein
MIPPRTAQPLPEQQRKNYTLQKLSSFYNRLSSSTRENKCMTQVINMKGTGLPKSQDVDLVGSRCLEKDKPGSHTHNWLRFQT